MSTGRGGRCRSVRAGVGLEVRLPGVHSDIGGSYEEKKEERRYLLAGERTRLLAAGWYTQDQLFPVSPGWYEGRRVLTHHYQFVPLALMVELAQQAEVKVTFESFDLDDNQDYRVPDDLQGLKALMRDFVQARPGPVSEQPYVPVAFRLPDEFMLLRKKYLHRSAVKGELSMNGIAMAGRETKGLPDRRHIPDAADVH